MSTFRIFLELYVSDIASNIEFFQAVLGFETVRNEGDFAELKHGDSTLLLNAYAGDIPGHFFHQKIDPSQNGVGVEIGIVTHDIEAAYFKATNHSFKKQISPLVLQDWGMRDFRLVTMDNYYLRVTTPKESS